VSVEGVHGRREGRREEGGEEGELVGWGKGRKTREGGGEER